MSDLNRSPSTGNNDRADARNDGVARIKWETPVLHRMSAQSAENAGNTGDDGPGASS